MPPQIPPQVTFNEDPQFRARTAGPAYPFLIGLVLKWGLAKDVRGAERVLLIAFAVILAAAAYFFFFGGSGGSKAKAPSAAEIERITNLQQGLPQ